MISHNAEEPAEEVEAPLNHGLIFALCPMEN